MHATKPVRNPGKQRKKLFNAPAHIRHKLMAAPLSPELLAQKGIKTLPVRKGDTVRIMRGDHKGFEGKISRVDLKRYRIYLEGLTREKVDGTAVFVALHPSKVMIKNLNLDDKLRKAVLERKKPIIKKKAEKASTKKSPTPKKGAKEKEAIEAIEEKPAAEEKPLIPAQEEAAAEAPEISMVEEVPQEKPKAKAATTKAAKATVTPKKPVAKKEKEAEAKPAEEKPSMQEETPKAAKKPAAKTDAPKAAAKKPAAKRKTTPKTEGGT